MNSVEHKTAQSRCMAAISGCDITPPVGIYHRMWGAAMHDQATGVHRPLEAQLLWLQPQTPEQGVAKQRGQTFFDAQCGDAQLILSLDHCILDSVEFENIRAAIARAADLDIANIHVTLTHTHGSGWMSRSRSHLPGGEMIGPYLDGLAEQLASLAVKTRETLQPATILYRVARCDLATHRDFWDPQASQYVVGWNPGGVADDTLLVAQVVAELSQPLAVLVNYACHPTTLAWDNTLLSPDWVGAMRELITQAAGVPCLFLQGASGDLGPREGFVGDAEVADRNGRQVGYAVLSALQTLPPAGTKYCYKGCVTSGARIGTWKHHPMDADQSADSLIWQWQRFTVDLPFRPDLPTIDQTVAEQKWWSAEEEKAQQSRDAARTRECRAQVEQRTRQLSRLQALGSGPSYPLNVTIGLVGQSLWVLVPGELYQIFQTTLRDTFPEHPAIVATLTNDWQPGYIPPASAYGHDIYQEVIAATAPGSLELLIQQCILRIKEMLDGNISKAMPLNESFIRDA
jgi:hypothetical protein